MMKPTFYSDNDGNISYHDGETWHSLNATPQTECEYQIGKDHYRHVDNDVFKLVNNEWVYVGTIKVSE